MLNKGLMIEMKGEKTVKGAAMNSPHRVPNKKDLIVR